MCILGFDLKTKIVPLGMGPRSPKCSTTELILCPLKCIYYGWVVVNVFGASAPCPMAPALD